MLSQGECWDAWSADRPEPTDKIKNLKQAAQDAWDEARELGEEEAEQLYKRRGEQIDILIYEGGYIPTDDEGDIRLDYVDTLIRMYGQHGQKVYPPDTRTDFTFGTGFERGVIEPHSAAPG